jgi:Rha family phage regulatory protein
MKLQVTTNNGIEVLDSREVAQAIEIRHADLLEKINTYSDFLANGKFRSLDFFVPSDYVDAQGKTRPRYLLTRKGCDMVANKMTGEKGVLFTAAYVTAFEEMQKRLKTSPSPAEQLLAQAQLMVDQERRIAALETGQTQMRDTMSTAFSALASPTVSRDHWQDETRQKIRRVCFENGLNYQQFTAQTYDELEADARVKLETRVNNQRERMKAGGAKSAEIQAVNKLTVIAADPKLRAIYSAIIQRHSAQFLTERFSNM